MCNWINIKDKLPEVGQLIIAWDGDAYTICKYEKALTWKGYKLKFVNLMSKYGAWNDNVTHWMNFPKPPLTEKQELHEYLENNPR